MNATQLITETLRAMGAAPTVTSKNGADIIKLNAPTVTSSKEEETRKCKK